MIKTPPVPTPPDEISRKGLWEILVPTTRNDGRPFHTRYHRVWDREVERISGGMTLMPVANGRWTAPDGTRYAERMIPVRILATRDEMSRIVDYTIRYYEQLAVLAYEISSNVILRAAPAAREKAR